MSGAFTHRDGRLHCEGVPAQQLVAEYGTPLYVYSAGTLRRRLRAFRDAFAELTPLVAYSVKANGNLSLLQLLGAEGAGADIVSGGELHRALRAGIPADRILYSGVGKTVIELAAALRAGIHAFNVESAGELVALSELAAAMNVRARIALRVNPDIQAPTAHHYTATGGGASKFGIPYDEARALYARAATLPGIEVRGVDVHIGSQILDPEPFRQAALCVRTLVEQLRADGHALEFVDLGGGFGIDYEADEAPDVSLFAAALVPLLRPLALRVIFEPGRFISGPAGILLTRVLFVKEMGGKTYVITDAGMNDLLRPSHYASYHRIMPVEERAERRTRVVDVVGPICESGDFLALDRALPLPQPGELLAVATAGAYGFSMASTYNARPRPAEVMVEGGAWRLARARERYEDLVRGEALPE